MTPRSITGDILVFLCSLTVISGLFYFLVINAESAASPSAGGAGRIFNIGLMWSPAAAALLTIWLRKADIASIGWSWGESRWITIAYLLPLGYVALAYSLVWIMGFGTFGDKSSVAGLARSLGWPNANAATVLIGYVGFMAVLGMVSAIATALGEEIGWRGFLLPRLVEKTGFTCGALAVGVIMLLWHLPVIFFGAYNQGTSPWVAIPCFATAIVSASVVSSWLRLRSGSVWPSTIFHAAHNLFIQGIFTPVTGSKGPMTAYVVGEFGLFVPTLLLGSALYFWTRRGDAIAQPALA